MPFSLVCAPLPHPSRCVILCSRSAFWAPKRRVHRQRAKPIEMEPVTLDKTNILLIGPTGYGQGK